MRTGLKCCKISNLKFVAWRRVLLLL